MYQPPVQKVVWAQSESRLSVGQVLFPVKPACVLPEPLGSCGGIAPGPLGHSAAGEQQYSECVSESGLCVCVCEQEGV